MTLPSPRFIYAIHAVAPAAMLPARGIDGEQSVQHASSCSAPEHSPDEEYCLLEPVSIDTLLASVGKEVGVSPWREVTQRMIDLFADATDDHQFIHVDPERAASETPF